MSNDISSRERGGTRLKALVIIVVFAALLYAGIKIVPVYVNNYDLQDAMQQEARFVFNPNTGRPKSMDEIRSELVKKAGELGLPLDSDSIKVTQDGSKITIWADYNVQVDLIVYQLSLHFHPQADNTSI